MWKWVLTIGILLFLGGCLWMVNRYLSVYQQSNVITENSAWFNCLNQSNPENTGGNMGCRGLYPNAYKLWQSGFNK